MEEKEKEFKGNNGGFIWTEPVPPHLRACSTSDKVCVCSSDCKFLNNALNQPKDHFQGAVVLVCMCVHGSLSGNTEHTSVVARRAENECSRGGVSL